ncbi:MAG: anhydro-N-acetylmuramic acid kinase [Alphaproteobacteria bacterium]|nr:anhydro-N-acetylmuramic acid kinase [Alphaproteobacteria bacterium]
MIIKGLNCLGMMGSSTFGGVELSLIHTDGIDIAERKKSCVIPYPNELKEKIQSIWGLKRDEDNNEEKLQDVDMEVSQFYVKIINDFIEECGEHVDLIGTEGITVLHNPNIKYTYQLGNGRFIAKNTGIKTVTHFRNADIVSGGQGTPISSTYFNAVATNEIHPIAYINISGKSSLTWIGSFGEIVGFDCGPGDNFINNWTAKHAHMDNDYNGRLAALGNVHEKIVNSLMHHKFFAKFPPKSAYTGIFADKAEHLEGLSLEDGAATATAFVAEAICYSICLYLPELPKKVVICGKGANNPTLVRFIRQRLPNIEVIISKEDGIPTDTVNAEICAFLSARTVYSLPITFPSTTGVEIPMPGGEIYEKDI